MTSSNVSIVSRRPSGLDGNAEIDVTPVMNMFIILIPFLVSMAVFTHLATHALSLPVTAPPPGEESLPRRTATSSAVPSIVTLVRTPRPISRTTSSRARATEPISDSSAIARRR